MQVIPAIDVLDGKVVRLRQGSYRQVTEYGDDPVAVGREWMEQGAGLVHVIDLEGARSGRPDSALWETLAGGGINFQVGGGIRDAASARTALAAGAKRVVMGSAAIWDPEELAAVGDPDRVVAALDIAAGNARGSGWMEAGRPWQEALAGVQVMGVSRVLVTAISRDGTMEGPDLGLLSAVQTEFPAMRLIASGGVGTLDDLRRLSAGGFEAVIVGRALYEGVFTLAQAMAANA